MGLGIRELKILCNTIKEIAFENGISYRDAIEQFLERVEKLYDGIKLRQKINQQQKEKQPKYAKTDNLPRTYPYHPGVQPFVPSLERSTLEEWERERQMPSVKYYRYRETNTTTIRQQDKNKKKIINQIMIIIMMAIYDR